MEDINKRKVKRRMEDRMFQILMETIRELKADIKDLKEQINGKFTNVNNCINDLTVKSTKNRDDIDTTNRIIWRVFIPSVLAMLGVIILTIWNIFSKKIIGG